MTLQKIVSLAAVLGRDPREFVQRIGAIAAGRIEPWRHRQPEYGSVEWETAAVQLGSRLGAPFSQALAESAVDDVEAQVRERLARLHGGPIADRHNGDWLFARCCYAVLRAVRPRLVIETGVAHGVSTTFMLAALEANGSGELHSIDLPPHDRGAESRVGACVPDPLRQRWTLHRGMSRDILPGLVTDLGGADVFVHDSQHTYANMRFEFATVREHAQVVIADDVELNRAFLELRSWDPQLQLTVRQAVKLSLFGVVVR